MKNESNVIKSDYLVGEFVKTNDVLKDACEIIESSRKAAYQAVNVALVKINWLLVYRIAEEELDGKNVLNTDFKLLKDYQIKVL